MRRSILNLRRDNQGCVLWTNIRESQRSHNNLDFNTNMGIKQDSVDAHNARFKLCLEGIKRGVKSVRDANPERRILVVRPSPTVPTQACQVCRLFINR
jgi:hypothetical protein